MRTTIVVTALCALTCLARITPVCAQQHDGPYSYSWNHAHQHTCGQYSEYPWSRCQSESAHQQALANPDMRHSCESTTCSDPGCGSCGQGHCSPRHIYQRNCGLIKDLRCEYCIPRATVEQLCRDNEAAYHRCRMYPSGTCFQCAPPRDYGCRPTLESVHHELQSLQTKCFVNVHK